MIDLDAMDKDPWPTWPVDKNELRGLVDEIERLREKEDDWRAAMTENHDLWNENERLRAALEKIAQHDMQAIALNALRLNPVRTRPAKEASDDAAT
jgi:regulator of replication initiation timing